MTSTLLPVVSEKALAAALKAFEAALGADAVLTDDEHLREFRDPFSYPTWDDYTAARRRDAGVGRGGPGDRPRSRTSTRCRCGRTGPAGTTATAVPRLA